jgi:hypothetical protein
MSNDLGNIVLGGPNCHCCKGRHKIDPKEAAEKIKKALDNTQSQAGLPVDSSELLVAFMEEYEWVKACMDEMKEKPDVYNKVDHDGLPYAMMVLKTIAEKAKINLTPLTPLQSHLTISETL